MIDAEDQHGPRRSLGGYGGVGERRDRTRVDVAGMGNHQRTDVALAGAMSGRKLPGAPLAAEAVLDLVRQGDALLLVELARHGRSPPPAGHRVLRPERRDEALGIFVR